MIFQVSYFLGIFYYIYCDVTRQFESEDVRVQGDFISRFMSEHTTAYQRAIQMTYFAFTSLSTVGFGDMFPQNNSERLLTAFILLFGVAIFSYVMGNFIEILETFKSVNQDFDDGDHLSKFFGLIKQFNKGQNIDYTLQFQIEDFFDYRWVNDRNQAISTQDDIDLISQLPLEIQRKIYSDFLFKNFLQSFRKYFTMPNYENRNKNSFYTWFNFDYQNFMIEVLQKLEPIFIKAKTVMYNELDDVNEVTFVQQGQYDVGYEINKQVHLKMRFPNKTVIGQFEVCFDKRILFIFKSFHDCKGYIIRKQNFRDLENEHFMLYQGLKNKALFNYINKIRRPLLSMKQQDIEHYDMRADYKQVLALRNYDENEMQELVDREMVRQNHKMDSEETIQMKEIERRINVYQRFLTNILIKCD